MNLTNQQYNSITREYDKLRLKNVHDLESRRAEIYEKIPEIKEIQDEISRFSVEEAKNRLSSGQTHRNSEIKEHIQQLSQRKAVLLTQHGFPKDYLTMHFTCNDCQDTGYIGNEMCACMKKKIIHILYEQSNLKELIARENFSTFRADYYPEDFVDPNTGLTARTNILEALRVCKDFVANFEKSSQNLFIYGGAGRGKTFLVNCIAKELLESSHSVIYMSAIHFFEVLADASFHKGSNLSDYESTVQRDLYDCDLLIIDDLGTEMANSFTASSLFNCINERSIRKKPIIISTNLALENLRDLYSDRVFSRIASNYKMLKIFGHDLRILQSIQ